MEKTQTQYIDSHYKRCNELIATTELTSFLRWAKQQRVLNKKLSPLQGYFYEESYKRITKEGLDPRDYE